MSENAKEQISCSPDTQQPATLAQPAATLGCRAAAGLRVPVPLAGAGRPGADTRPDWSTLMLRGSFYHPTTLALVRGTKVWSDFF